MNELMKVLVVDDSRCIQAILGDLLNSIGIYNVEFANDGREAYSLIEEKENYDLVISDINMPIWSGIKLIEEVSKSAKGLNLPFIFLSAEIDEVTFNSVKSMGAVDFIAKPFDPEKFIDTIMNFIEYNLEKVA